MAARVIDGRAIAAELRRRVADAAATLKRDADVTVGLATILVGDDPPSQAYVRAKARASLAAGLASFEVQLPTETTEATLIGEIERLGADDRVDGILVQLPLPPPIDTRRVVAAIDPAKDVDGLHPVNVGRLWSGIPALVPCTPQGCLRLLRDALGDIAGVEAVVLGRSSLVGRPMAALLVGADCTVTIVHSKTRDPAAICRGADILVAAAGRPGLIKAGWVKPGATVIDAGTTSVPLPQGGSRLVGDVDFAEVSAIAGALTPVPGGVGPMTIACLLRNTLLAAARRRGVADPAI
jgi:methylenetetrahydrofolate dehydrogenase (NADP+)/methenyltetrahydrofolate cyclohydrolase